MSREPTQLEIKEFIASNGLDSDVLDEREETLEAWREECNLLIRGFVNFFEGRFSAIEHRLDRLEKRVKKGTDIKRMESERKRCQREY